jgi:hypothetical protein
MEFKNKQAIEEDPLAGTNRSHPYRSKVLKNKELQASSSDKSTRHVVFDLSGCKVIIFVLFMIPLSTGPCRPPMKQEIMLEYFHKMIQRALQELQNN